jgi:hypothetical protein
MLQVEWFGEHALDLLISKELHSLISIDHNNPLQIGEPVRVVCAPSEGSDFRYICGVGEVVSIKRCAISELDTQDLSRLHEGYRSVRDVVRSLRFLYPDSDVNLNTEAVIHTIRRADYSLSRLNKLVKSKPKIASI